SLAGSNSIIFAGDGSAVEGGGGGSRYLRRLMVFAPRKSIRLRAGFAVWASPLVDPSGIALARRVGGEGVERPNPGAVPPNGTHPERGRNFRPFCVLRARRATTDESQTPQCRSRSRSGRMRRLEGGLLGIPIGGEHMRVANLQEVVKVVYPNRR